MKMFKICLLGLDFSSGNLGCGALSYGFITILNEIAEKLDLQMSVDILSPLDESVLNIINSDKLSCREKKRIGNRHFFRNIRSFNEYDLVFDFTAGDSFSDIYGLRRFLLRSYTKLCVIWSKSRLVLGSQTYGPFKSKICKGIAKYIIQHSFRVFTRDSESGKLVFDLTGIKPILTADVAFALSYVTHRENNNRIKVGINPSGLLWNGGYSSNNQFNLTVNYKDYCKQIVQDCVEKGYEVHLIGHVISDDLHYPDNDLIAIRELHSLFPETIESPVFENPMQAKSYISEMDVLVGARMHATIAAYSSGVAVIPFAYSKKFQGLFYDLGYDFIVDGRELKTEDAVERTEKLIYKRMELSEAIKSSKQNDVLLKTINEYEQLFCFIMKKGSNEYEIYSD